MNNKGVWLTDDIFFYRTFTNGPLEPQNLQLKHYCYGVIETQLNIH